VETVHVIWIKRGSLKQPEGQQDCH